MTNETVQKSAENKVAKTVNAESNELRKTKMVELLRTDGLSRAQAAQAVDTLLGAISSTLEAGHSVSLNGVGTLRVRATQARTATQPGTTKKIEIPAGRKVSFSVSSTLKTSLRS